MKRREILQLGGVSALLGLAGCAGIEPGGASKAKVLVVGGGFGGATAARYVRLLSNHQIDVTLVEPQSAFVSCAMSNLVVGGSRQLAEVTMPYDGLASRHGVRVVRDRVSSIDTQKKVATLASGTTIAYDKLVLSPGVDMLLDSVEGLSAAHASGQVVHAWKAGAETQALRRQLEAMADGAVFVISAPEMPYRCPPAPYERACLVAEYMRSHKPRSKVLLLDANRDVVAKGPLFKKVWAEQYAGLIEYRPQHRVVGVDTGAGLIKIDGQSDVRAAVMNVVPAMRAGQIAVSTGLVAPGSRWCPVNLQSFESTLAKDVHVIGDAVQSPPGMPKSGHMANNQAKVAAAAIVAELSGLELNPSPILMNACYSWVSTKSSIHLAGLYEYIAAEKTYKPVAGAGGVSAAPNEVEGGFAWDWARSTWADTLA
ncbi:MAG: NAD(P)/FAD-dependent oxidoreductase [Rhizobacter sp.]